MKACVAGVPGGVNPGPTPLTGRKEQFSMIAAATTYGTTMMRRDGTSLLGWLELLGWRVEIEREGSRWAGVARLADSSAGERRVRGYAASHREVVSELYRGALHSLSSSAAV
jgi:hypothetical protein